VLKSHWSVLMYAQYRALLDYSSKTPIEHPVSMWPMSATEFKSSRKPKFDVNVLLLRVTRRPVFEVKRSVSPGQEVTVHVSGYAMRFVASCHADILYLLSPLLSRHCLPFPASP